MHFRSQRKSASDVSLSDYIETGKDGTALSLMDVVCQDDDLFDRVSNREDVRLLRQYIDQVLDPREQKVLTLRYGLDGKEPLPQREVAQQCNISRSYISRIEKRRWRNSEAPLRGNPDAHQSIPYSILHGAFASCARSCRERS